LKSPAPHPRSAIGQSVTATAPGQKTGPSPAAPEPRILLLGLGNDLLSDDAVGLRVVAEARRLLASVPNITVLETSEMGLALLDFVVGYDELVLVDSIQTGKAPAGRVHEIDGLDLRALPAVSPHFLGVGEVLALGRELGMAVPRRVRIFAVEVEDPFTMGTEMTPALQAAFAGVVQRVVTALLGAAGGVAPHGRAGGEQVRLAD
jgi:hydrogenase maturation protease